jgi:hypothetical protein
MARVGRSVAWESDMALTPQAVRDQIDQRLTNLWPTVLAKQQAYLASKGRYFQGLRSSSTIPADGADVPPDNLTAHPHYQAESWQSMGGFPATEMSQIECHQYDGPQGKGFVLILTVLLAGQTWRRTVNYGPETWRGTSWQIIS